MPSPIAGGVTSGSAPTPTRPISRAWLPIGGILFILVIAALFFVFSSAHARHEYNHSAVPARDAPSQPGATTPD